MKAEDIAAENLEMIYDKISKAGCYTVFTRSIEAAKHCVKTFVRVNRELKLPVEFIRKGKYVTVVLKGRGGFIKDIPDSSHAMELFLVVQFGGEDAMNRIRQLRARGIEPEVMVDRENGKIGIY